ncbi:MAG TPA: hypothetical protein VJK51_05580 [Candidatus Nanoarchaeia archaeon]|nr:hypothetical protein [Candidatus Nanoarchaeia archaeon]
MARSHVMGIALALVGVVIIGALVWYWYVSSSVVVTDFESCATAGGSVAESYPRQCFYDGMRYVEEIGWINDGITLMRNKETREYACFGCGATLCVDPAPVMEEVQESETKHCTIDFMVVGE